MEELSRITQVLERLGKKITEDERRFLDVPIYWGMMELIADNMPYTAVVFEPRPFGLDETGCVFERQLDIIIVHNTDYEREITIRLTKYAEDMVELINEYVMSCPEELQFLQGSEIKAKRNNRDDTESYKGVKTDYSSIIVLSYLLRY